MQTSLIVAAMAAASPMLVACQAHAGIQPVNSATPSVAVTKSQAFAAGMRDLAANFEKIDANRDGLVTRDELRAWVLANRRYAPMT